MGKLQDAWASFVQLNRFAFHEAITGHTTAAAWREASTARRIGMVAQLALIAALIAGAVVAAGALLAG